jgi:hypothetical protein
VRSRMTSRSNSAAEIAIGSAAGDRMGADVMDEKPRRLYKGLVADRRDRYVGCVDLLGFSERVKNDWTKAAQAYDDIVDAASPARGTPTSWSARTASGWSSRSSRSGRSRTESSRCTSGCSRVGAGP